MTPTEIEAGNVNIAMYVPDMVLVDKGVGKPYFRRREGDLCIRGDFYFGELKYHTSFDWFVPVWNKAVREISMIIKNLPDNELTPALVKIFDATDDLSHEFTIFDRLPVLLEIIDFLNQNKK